MYKKYTALILTVILFISAFSLNAFASDAQIRQASVELPSVIAEISGNVSADSIKQAKIGDEVLTFEGVTEKESVNRVVYMLVDISTSMSQSALNAIKPSLIDYASSLGAEDKVVIISFGREYKTVLDGAENKDEIKNAINGLRCNSDGTSFYGALNYAYELAGNETGYDRKYAIVVSDGEDYEKGNTSQQEVIDNYETHRLPVYGFCLSSASKSQADSFGYMARNSGGELITFSSYDASAAFGKMEKIIDDVTVVRFSSASGKSAGKQLFVVDVDGTTLHQDVLVRGGKDTTPPEIEKIECDKNSKAFIITFSENVDGADNPNAYDIKKGRQSLSISSVECDKNKATIYMSKVIYSGTYTFNFSSITDSSDNANALTVDSVKERISGRSVIWKVLTVLGIIMIPVGFLAALYLILLNLKKKKQVEKIKDVFITQVEEKEHQQIHIKQPTGLAVKFYIDAGSGQFHTVDYNLISSIIIGQSDFCDLFVDDCNMASQHFAMEQVERGLSVVDLQTANGTYVNGVRIQSPTFVKSGDKITAGNSTITVVFSLN